MCGINGMVFLKGVKRDEQMMSKIRYVFDELMVETQDRGEHATGIASFKRDGSYELHKKDINADTMTTEDEAYRNIVSNFNGDETSVVIAHTRYLTKGKADNNDNNHPFDIGNVIGLHNGSAKNDDSLFLEYKDKFTRVGEVDSEIVFQLINHYNPANISLLGLKNALEDTKLRGLFALAFVHKNDTNTLHLIKQDKPMHLAYWHEAGIIIFNSIDDYIVKAFRKLERTGKTLGIKNARQTVEIMSVLPDRYFTVNANAETMEDAVSEDTRFYIESSSYTYTSYKGGKHTNKNQNTYQSVTAKDSKGIVLHGEIDTTTGEVVIWSDDKAEGDEDFVEAEICMECAEWLGEEELTAGFNANNPEGERVCSSCYKELIESFIADDEKEENKVG